MNGAAIRQNGEMGQGRCGKAALLVIMTEASRFLAVAFVACSVMSNYEASAAKAAPKSPEGVVVESAEPGGAAGKAGLKPGDLLVSWERLPSPPANPEAAAGKVEAVFDWNLMLAEQAPRGPVKLKVVRAGESLDAVLPPGRWDLAVRPAMDEATLKKYTEGTALLDSKETEKGLGVWEELAQSLKAEGRLDQACWLFLKIGRTWEKAGKRDKALQAYQKATESALDKKNTQAIAEAWTAAGQAYKAKNDFAKAEEAYRAALDAREKSGGETMACADSLNNVGALALARGDMAGAEAFYKRSLGIREKLAPDSLNVAGSLNNLGELALNRGDLAWAETCHKRSLAIKEKLAPGSLTLAGSLNNLGVLAWNRGDLSGAEAYYKRSLAIFEKLSPDSLEVAGILNNLGALALNWGDLAGAEAYHKRSLGIREKLAPDSLNVAMSLNNLAVLAKERGDLEAAEGFWKRSLAIYEKLAPESLDVATSLINLGNLSHDLGNLDAAEDFYKRSLAIREKLAPESLDVAMSLNNLGELARSRGDLDAAGGFHERCLALREKLAPGSAFEGESLYNLARLYQKKGDLHKALTYLQRAVGALETQRGKLGGGKEASERFSAKYADYYRDLIDLQLKLDKMKEAFGTLERFRARSLLEMLAERDLVFSEDAPEELIQEQKRADFEYDKVQGKIAGLSPEKDSARVEELLKKLGELRQKQKDVAEKIRKASPKLASLQYPEPLNLEGAKAAVDPGVLFLSYSVGEETTRLFALLDGKLEVYAIPVRREDLKKEVRLFRTFLTDPAGGAAQLSKKSRDLYDILLKPARKQIEESRFVVICPDGALHALPFSALMTGRKKYLIEEKPVSYAISATVLAQLRAPGERAHALPLAAFGDPAYPGGQGHSEGSTTRGFLPGQSLLPLPATREEVNRICALFPGQAEKFLGDHATEEKAKKLGKDVRYIHFACHGLFDERFPLDSGLAFSIPEKVEEGQDNGILQAWEIFEKMRIDADLVSLSACQSGLGKEMGGEGLIGLTRAFEYAGARSVLSSLWSVSDESTALLMTRFYVYLKEGKPKAEALRLAQIELINSGKGRHPKSVSPHSSPLTPHSEWSHPFYWAAFVLNGT